MLQVNKILKNTFRFLKKLTFVDYLIIIIVLLGVIILYKFFNPRQEWIDVLVIDDKIPIYQTAALKVGDIEKDPNGAKIAEITDIESYNSPEPTDPTVVQQSLKDVFIQVKLQVKINPRSKEYEYKNKIIKVGVPIELRFNQVQINGKLAGIGLDSIPKYETKILTLKLYEQWPWFAEVIKVGGGESDGKGEKIVEILSKEIKPAEITVDTAGGEKLLRTDPQKVDLTLKLSIKVIRISDQLIFRKDTKIIIGKTLPFNAGNTQINNALIINIE